MRNKGRGWGIGPVTMKGLACAVTCPLSWARCKGWGRGRMEEEWRIEWEMRWSVRRCLGHRGNTQMVSRFCFLSVPFHFLFGLTWLHVGCTHTNVEPLPSPRHLQSETIIFQNPCPCLYKLWKPCVAYVSIMMPIWRRKQNAQGGYHDLPKVT